MQSCCYWGSYLAISCLLFSVLYQVPTPGYKAIKGTASVQGHKHRDNEKTHTHSHSNLSRNRDGWEHVEGVKDGKL